ncbi:MAG: biopolymer transporter ExbD [Saprospiraceae bacterium]|nr:biopolymer transporter ExbD [Saprospiraceae bacterium]
MGLKKRSRVSAEFSMSSLTDIIFLLLIFFMLTSSLVVPNALNLKLPGKSSRTTLESKPLEVEVKRNGHYYVAGRKISITGLQKAMRTLSRDKSLKNKTVVITPHPNVPHEYVAAIMDLALKYNISAILATPPNR